MAREVSETSDQEEVVERKDGLGNALVIATTLVLLLAIVLVHQAMKKHFGTGLFGNSKDGKPVGDRAKPRGPRD